MTGIGAKRAARIIAGWAERKVIREIMLFLHANGVGTSRAVRIYKTYGNDAVRVISDNPYRLARDIRGIGFRTADQIAAKVGIEKTALVRIRAGISYALAEAMNEGHCGLPVEELTVLTAKLLEVSDDLIATALALELGAGDVVADQLEGRSCVFLTGLYRTEQSIAERLRVLVSVGPSWPSIDTTKAIPWVEHRTGLQLAASQREAVQMALSSKVLVITGGPGVGKTTLVNSILKGVDRQAGPRGAVRAYRSGGQAVVGQYQAGGEDHPPPVGDGPADRHIPPNRGASSRLRSPGRGRGQHGGCPFDALAAARTARRCCVADSRRR